MKGPINTYTVTSGRETLGFINEMSGNRFVATVAATGEKLGPFATRSDAAQAINKTHGEVKPCQL